MNKRNPKTGYAEYYMDESRKPTDALSRAGRFGDDRIGIVDGEPAHINAWEEYLMDNYGEIGEEIVMNIGSGTYNPETGMKEYGWLKNAWNKYVKPIGKMNVAEAITYVSTGGLYDLEVQDKVDELTGQGKYTDEAIAERELREGLGSSMGETASVWSDQLERSLGPGGTIDKSSELDRSAIYSNTASVYDNWKAKSDFTIGHSGFSGMKNQKFDFKNAQLDTEKSFQDQSKRRADLLSSMEMEMNRTLANYFAATGEDYTGKAFDDLRSEIERYKLV